MLDNISVQIMTSNDECVDLPVHVPTPAPGDTVLFKGHEYVIDSRTFEYRRGDRVQTLMVILYEREGTVHAS